MPSITWPESTSNTGVIEISPIRQPITILTSRPGRRTSA
jgi:hypothetical protein